VPSELWIPQHLKPSILPSNLYHYTDFVGLQGILESGVLRATYSRTLNDGSEQEFGEAVVSNALTSPKEGFFTPKTEPLFVTCFCEQFDVLSMWRSYAAYGGGYCLELNPERLSSNLETTPEGYASAMLVKIVYGTDLPVPMKSHLQEIDDRLGALYAKLLALSSLGNGLKSQEATEIIADIEIALGYATSVSVQSKHPAFQEEKEWRLIVKNPSPALMMFRAGHANIKPYVELHRKVNGAKAPLPITKVYYGPTLRSGASLEQSIGWLLERYGYKDVPVEPCGIPYQF
jgi:Protein of unknown function (DUF2971)